MQEILENYKKFKHDIKTRREEFKQVWEKGKLFDEFVFCLFTPQSKAEACWQTVLNLKKNDLLKNGNPSKMKKYMQSVRFYKTKSKRVVDARKHYNLKETIEKMNEKEAREWLVKNVNGFGYKEASHFLRNIGFADNLMILDRHILRNLIKYKVIEEIPKNLTRKKYFEIEDKMIKFSISIGIHPSELDMIWWAKETGKVFK